MLLQKIIDEIHDACTGFDGDFVRLHRALRAVLESNSSPDYRDRFGCKVFYKEDGYKEPECEIMHRFMHGSGSVENETFAFTDSGGARNVFQACLAIISKDPTRGSYETAATLMAFGSISVHVRDGDRIVERAAERVIERIANSST
jgi:hypothetical protein